MNTPTHFLMTAALRKSLPFPISRSAVLLGSVAPDIPLYALSFGGLFYFHKMLGWEMSRAARHVFGTLYFHDPIWIACHNLLHSPLSLLAGLAATRCLARTSCRRGRAEWIGWFLASCLLHSLVDVATHHDDGPLLLWPLNWSLRWHSPISYWDPAHFGRPMAIFERYLVGGLTAYLVLPWLWSRIRRIFRRRD